MVSLRLHEQRHNPRTNVSSFEALGSPLVLSHSTDCKGQMGKSSAHRVRQCTLPVMTPVVTGTSRLIGKDVQSYYSEEWSTEVDNPIYHSPLVGSHPKFCISTEKSGLLLSELTRSKETEVQGQKLHTF